MLYRSVLGGADEILDKDWKGERPHPLCNLIVLKIHILLKKMPQTCKNAQYGRLMMPGDSAKIQACVKSRGKNI